MAHVITGGFASALKNLATQLKENIANTSVGSSGLTIGDLANDSKTASPEELATPIAERIPDIAAKKEEAAKQPEVAQASTIDLSSEQADPQIGDDSQLSNERDEMSDLQTRIEKLTDPTKYIENATRQIASGDMDGREASDAMDMLTAPSRDNAKLASDASNAVRSIPMIGDAVNDWMDSPHFSEDQLDAMWITNDEDSSIPEGRGKLVGEASDEFVWFSPDPNAESWNPVTRLMTAGIDAKQGLANLRKNAVKGGQQYEYETPEGNISFDDIEALYDNGGIGYETITDPSQYEGDPEDLIPMVMETVVGNDTFAGDGSDLDVWPENDGTYTINGVGGYTQEDIDNAQTTIRNAENPDEANVWQYITGADINGNEISGDTMRGIMSGEYDANQTNEAFLGLNRTDYGMPWGENLGTDEWTGIDENAFAPFIVDNILSSAPYMVPYALPINFFTDVAPMMAYGADYSTRNPEDQTFALPDSDMTNKEWLASMVDPFGQIATEYIGGIVPGGGIGGSLAKKLGSNVATRSIVGAGEEGMEEVLASLMSEYANSGFDPSNIGGEAVADESTYAYDEDGNPIGGTAAVDYSTEGLSDEERMANVSNNLIDSFLGGALVGLPIVTASDVAKTASDKRRRSKEGYKDPKGLELPSQDVPEEMLKFWDQLESSRK